MIVVKLSSRCGYCKRLTPELPHLGEKFDPPLRFATVDCTGGCPDSPNEGYQALMTLMGGVPELVYIAPSSKDQIILLKDRTFVLPMIMTRYYGYRQLDSYMSWASLHSGSRTTIAPFWWQIVLGIYHRAIWILVIMLESLSITATADASLYGRPYLESLGVPAKFLKDGGSIASAGILVGGLLLLLLLLGCCCHCCCHRRCCKKKTD